MLKSPLQPKVDYQKHYHQWLFGRKTLVEVSSDLGVSYPKLIKEFDQIDVAEGLQEDIVPYLPINLLIDAYNDPQFSDQFIFFLR